MLVRIGRWIGCRPKTAIDTTPGGSANALLLENGSDGFLLEDGSGVILME